MFSMPPTVPNFSPRVFKYVAIWSAILMASSNSSVLSLGFPVSSTPPSLSVKSFSAVPSPSISPPKSRKSFFLPAKNCTTGPKSHPSFPCSSTSESNVVIALLKSSGTRSPVASFRVVTESLKEAIANPRASMLYPNWVSSSFLTPSLSNIPMAAPMFLTNSVSTSLLFSFWKKSRQPSAFSVPFPRPCPACSN